MQARPPKERLACLVVAHNLGDAVIQSGFLKELAALGYAEKYLVWTRPQVAFLFADIPDCEVVRSQFPIGTSKQMGGTALFTFLKAAWQVRRRHPSVTIDLIGDLRDRLFARLAGTPRHLHIGWAEGHPFNRLIRNPFGTGGPFVMVPADVPNVYAAHGVMLRGLVPGAEAVTSGSKGRAARVPGPLRVGLHPFASQACKLWPDACWRELAQGLIAAGAELTAFGAPFEREALQALFGPVDAGVGLVTGDIPNFAREVSRLDVLIGLDSFSVHMAQRQSVRSVMVNAGNPPPLWAAPGGVTLAHSGGCSDYPCYNVPRCAGTDHQYACVRSVSPREALAAVLD